MGILIIGAGITPETAGYSSGAMDTGTIPNSTTGFVITGVNISTAAWSGAVTLSSFGTLDWVSSGVISSIASGYIGASGGSKTVSSSIGVIRITTVNGTDTFDAGTIIKWNELR